MRTIKFIPLLFCLLFFSTTAFSQKKELKVMTETKIVGKNYMDGSDIEGIEYKFQDRIDNYFFDTENRFLTLQLRGYKAMTEGLKAKGNILQYDLNNHKILWTKAIDYDMCELLKFDNLLIFNDYNDAYGLDANTGENLWRVRNYIYFANPKRNVGVAYEYIAAGDGYYTNNLFGVHLWSGKPLWKRSINRAFGWNDYFYLNDSTLLVAAAGLHSININTGEGWDYNTPTGKNLNVTPSGTEITGAVIGGLIGGLVGGLIGGVIGGSLTNYGALITGSEVIRDIASNTLINNDFIYFASKDTLTKLNKHTGQPTWKCTFEKDITSNSFIFLNGNELYMINNGFAFRGQRQIDYGKPFIAAFNATTGKQKYLQLLNKNDGPVIDFKLIDNEIYLLFKNAIGKYDLESGKQILETTFSKAVIGDLEYFAGNQYFIANRDDSFLFIDQYDLSTIQIYTTTRKIITLDEQFNVMHTINYENIGVYYEQYKDYYLIENDKKTFLVNTDGERVAEFEATANAFIMDNILYDKQFRSIIAIDLQNIITK